VSGKAKGETGLKRAILDALNASGLVEAWNQPSGQHRVRRGFLHCAPKGSSDLCGYFLDGSGRHLALEIKIPGEKAKPEQTAALERVIAAGGVGAVVCSVVEALAVVQREFRRAS